MKLLKLRYWDYFYHDPQSWLVFKGWYVYWGYSGVTNDMFMGVSWTGGFGGVTVLKGRWLSNTGFWGTILSNKTIHWFLFKDWWSVDPICKLTFLFSRVDTVQARPKKFHGHSTTPFLWPLNRCLSFTQLFGYLEGPGLVHLMVRIVNFHLHIDNCRREDSRIIWAIDFLPTIRFAGKETTL